MTRNIQLLPPADLQAEQRLIGATLVNNLAYERISEFLAPEHFADPIHGRVFAAIRRRVEAGHLADAVTLRDELADPCSNSDAAARLRRLLMPVKAGAA